MCVCPVYLAYFLLTAVAGAIEASYSANNPYHTAVHAADVMQATHCNILQSPVYISIYLSVCLLPTPACVGRLSVKKETAPIQLAQCRFPGLAISNAKILVYFSNKIYGSNFIKRHSETVMV